MAIAKFALAVFCFVIAIPAALHEILKLGDRFRCRRERARAAEMLGATSIRSLWRDIGYPVIAVALLGMGLVLLLHRQTNSAATSPSPRQTQQIQPAPPTPESAPPKHSSKLPRPAAPTSGQTVNDGVNCTRNSGNCAGINNGVQTLNQYGPRQLVMTDVQRDAIAADLGSQFVGLSVAIIANESNDSVRVLVGQVAAALRAGGFSVDGPHPGTPLGLSPGMTFTVGTDRKDAAEAIGESLIRRGVLSKRVPAIPSSDPNALIIWITPQE